MRGCPAVSGRLFGLGRPGCPVPPSRPDPSGCFGNSSRFRGLPLLPCPEEWSRREGPEPAAARCPRISGVACGGRGQQLGVGAGGCTPSPAQPALRWIRPMPGSGFGIKENVHQGPGASRSKSFRSVATRRQRRGRFIPPSRGHPCTGRRCGWACATGGPRRARGRAAGSSAPPPRGRRRSTTPSPRSNQRCASAERVETAREKVPRS